MPEYPETILEFRDWFADEDGCRGYLARLRWPDGFVCPRCQGREYWNMKRGLYWCRGCDYQTSVTAGTLFADSHKPLRLWFEAMWYVTNQKYGVSALGLMRVLGLGSYDTAWTWLHKLRRAMVRPGRDRLQGEIEVDETFVGGVRPGKRGRGAEGKTLVFIAAQAAEKGIGRIRLKQIEDASAATLESALLTMAEPGCKIRTDGWQGYTGLKAQGYDHQVIRESKDVGENLLPLANRVAALIKRWLLGTHQGAVQFSHLDYYLA